MDSYTPPIRTQVDLEDLWHELLAPLGFDHPSLWLLVIGPDDRPVPHLTEVAGADRPPTDTEAAGLAGLLRRHVDELAPDGRVACLRSRPGTDPINAGDRAWARLVYDAAQAAGTACEVVHMANDVRLLPVPLDEVPLPRSA